MPETSTCQRHVLKHITFELVMANKHVDLATLQPETVIVTEEDPALLTARNDGMINSLYSYQHACGHAVYHFQTSSY